MSVSDDLTAIDDRAALRRIGRRPRPTWRGGRKGRYARKKGSNAEREREKERTQRTVVAGISAGELAGDDARLASKPDDGRSSLSQASHRRTGRRNASPCSCCGRPPRRASNLGRLSARASLDRRSARRRAVNGGAGGGEGEAGVLPASGVAVTAAATADTGRSPSFPRRK